MVGIYLIENKINGKGYVGLSVNIQRRWWDHRSKSMTSNKKEDLDKPLYKAMRKYGLENFKLTILEECPEEKLKEREIFWIEKLDTYRKGYNATLGGDTPSGEPLKGEKHGMSKLTEEQVRFCREAYRRGDRARDIYDKYFNGLMTFPGFQRMWHGKTWKHVCPEVFKENPNPKQKLTEEIVRDMKKEFSNGKSCAEVYHKYNRKFSRTTINDIYHGKRYGDVC